MATLVRTVCRDCGQPVRGKGSGNSRTYVHLDDWIKPGPRVDATIAQMRARKSGCDASPVLIRMETVAENY